MHVRVVTATNRADDVRERTWHLHPPSLRALGEHAHVRVLPMARRRVLLFLKPFDVYPPRQCAGSAASFPTSLSPPPSQLRATNPKVLPLSHPLSILAVLLNMPV